MAWGVPTQGSERQWAHSILVTVVFASIIIKAEVLAPYSDFKPQPPY